MPDPCIINSQSISLGMNAGNLQAVAILSPDGDNHLEVRANGLYVPSGRGVGFTKVADTSTWSYNDETIHYHHDTRVAVANATDKAWACIAIACFDPGWIGLAGDSSAFAPFDVGTYLELVEEPAVFDARDGTVYASRHDVNVTASVGEGSCSIAFTVAPGATRNVHWFRWVQRLSGVNNPSGFDWLAGNSACSILRVG